MFDNEIMSQGERLKKYRKMLGATQTEVAEGVCKKAMISQIENNNTNLNYILATGIAENLNRIAKKKGMNISLITPEELMIDDNERANYIFTNSIMNELKEIKEIDLFEQKLRQAEELIEKCNITDNKKIEMYKLAADFYYYKHRYSKSDQMCDLGLKMSINSQNSFEEISFYIYKSRTNIFTGNYIKALQQLDYAEKLNNHIVNDELSVMVFFYKATTYKRLGEYDTALEYFKMIKQFKINDCDTLLKVKMNHANCLNDYNKFKEADKEYKETLSIAMKYDDKDYIAQTYRNLSELYFNKRKYKEAAEYIKVSLKDHPENRYIAETLCFAAKVFIHINEEVDIYLLQALEICERNEKEDLILIEDVIYELVLFYIKKEDKENLMLMADKAKELNIDYSLIYLEIGEYYRGRNEEKNKYFIRKSREKMKQNKKK